MVLKQIGFNNVRYFSGDYPEFFIDSIPGGSISLLQQYQAEKPLYNYSQIMNSSASPTQNKEIRPENTQQITPVSKKKKTQTGGGC